MEKIVKQITKNISLTKIKIILTQKFIVLVLIFALALFVRFWNLAKYPEAIDEDEMANGYYAFSLLKNGTDEYGHKFPLYFESVADYKYVGYSYFSTIPVGIFGLNPFSTRFLSAFAGSLTVILIYFLAIEIFNNVEFGLISSALMALSPFHIHFSRIAFSNILGAFFSILSILFFIRFFKKEKLKDGLKSLVFLILSIFTYQTYRVFLPAVFVLIPIFVYQKKVFSRKYKNLLLVTLASILIVFISFISPESRRRAQNFQGLINKPALIEQYSEDNLAGTKLIVTRIFHNKYLSVVQDFVGRYVSYFDPRFLFIETTSETERHSIPDIGFVYFIDAAFIFLGIIFLLTKVKGREKLIPFILLFSSPIAASMTTQPRSTTRAIIMVIPLVILSAFGVYSLFQLKKIGKYLLILSGIAYFISLYFFAHQYLVHKIYHHPWYGDVGLKEMVMSVNKNFANYSNVVVARGHYIPFLFYNKVNPKDFLNDSEISDKSDNDLRIKRFGKIIFNMPYNCPLAGKEKVLYVCFGYQIPQNSKAIEVIRYRDGQPAIILVEFGKGIDKILPERVEYYGEVNIKFPNGVLPNNYDSFWATK